MTALLKPLPAWLDLDERRSERHLMRIAAMLETQIQAAQIGVHVLDISTSGCLLEVPGGLALGRYVTLLLPGPVVIEGWIAWSKNDRAGLDYARSLPAAVVERVVSEHTPHAAD